MRKLHYIFWILASHFAQAQTDVERFWVNNGLAHSDVKSHAFYQVDSLSSDSSSKVSVAIAPDILAAYQQDHFRLRTGLNLVVQANVKNKLSFITSYRAGYSDQPLTRYASVMQPKAYFNSALKNDGYIYHDVRGRLAYTPNKYIQLQAGLDHLFIGEGDRSLLLGNQGIPNPFAQLRVRFWKLEYHFIQQVWHHYSPKGNATHYLSFKPVKNWTIGFFESVVYSMKDTLYNRGLEAEYLNPLVFFRPQEYNLGSSDNVLIGFNSSVQWRKNMLYGQVVIDDFFLAEIKARNRWWANKFGMQLGYKAWIDQGDNHFFVRSEFNLVRPFTYSQINPDIVFGNQGLPSAHPLGSNFVEFYQEVSFQRKDWKIQVWAQLYLKGQDSLNQQFSFGGDIYQPYDKRPEEYNFKIGRGMTYRALQLGTQVSKRVLSDKLAVFAEPRIVISNLEGNVKGDFYFTVGLHRPLGSDRRNY